MSVLLDSVADSLSTVTAGEIPAIGSLTVTFLMYHHGAWSAWEPALAFNSPGHYFFFGLNDHGTVWVDTDGQNAEFTAQPPTDVWLEVALVFKDSSNQVRCLWKRVSDVGWQGNLTVAWTVAAWTPTKWFFGADDFGGAKGKLSLSNIKTVAGVELSDANALVEADSASFVNNGSGFAWYKCQVASGFGHDSLSTKDLTENGTLTAGTNSGLEAPADGGSGGTGVVVGVERTTSAGAVTARGGAKAPAAGVERTTSAGAAPAHGGARTVVAGVERTTGAGNTTGRGGTKPVVAGVAALSAVGVVTSRGGARIVVVGAEALTSNGFISPIQPEPEPVVEEPILLGVADDASEFGRPMNFSGKVGGARGFAIATAGSKMIGGTSQVRKPGGVKWP